MDSLGMFDVNKCAFAQPSTPSARSIGGGTQGKPFKSQLHELFQRYNGSSSDSLQFQVTKSTTLPDPYFDCILHCVALPETTNRPCPPQTFSGSGRSKKIAENAASEQALIHYAALGIVPHPHPTGQPSMAAQVQHGSPPTPIPNTVEPPWQTMQGVHQQHQRVDQDFHQQMPLMQQQVTHNIPQQVISMQPAPQGLLHLPAQMSESVQPVYQYSPSAQGFNVQAQAPMSVSSHFWGGPNIHNENMNFSKSSIHEVPLAATGRPGLSSACMSKEQAINEMDQIEQEQFHFTQEEAEWIALANSDMTLDTLQNHFRKAVERLIALQKENHHLKKEVTRRKIVGNEIRELALCITSNDNEREMPENGSLGIE